MKTSKQYDLPYQMQEELKYKLQDDQKIKINVDIKQDHHHHLGQKKKY
jgi:hypothetical protein